MEGSEVVAALSALAHQTRLAVFRLLGLLGNYGGNLNQLAHVANASGKLPTEATLIEIAQQVREVRDAVMRALGHGD